MEWNTANSSAPSCVLKPPDTLVLTFNILMAASQQLYQHLDNASERAVLPFTNLRKSFGGFSSEKGGEVAAAWLVSSHSGLAVTF